MRHYRIQTPAERDARTERRVMTLEEAGILPRDPIPPREDGQLLLRADGQVIDLLLRPDRRHCWRWYALQDGEPFARGGLEQIWREVQRRRVPMLGARNL